jgi:hypothetical protein
MTGGLDVLDQHVVDPDAAGVEPEHPLDVEPCRGHGLRERRKGLRTAFQIDDEVLHQARDTRPEASRQVRIGGDIVREESP